MNQISSLAPQDVKVIIVANKIDLDEERKVTTEEGQLLAAKYNVTFFEASAKTGHNVNEIFQTMGSQILEKVGKNPINEPDKTSQNTSVRNLDHATNKKKHTWTTIHGSML